MEEGQGKHKLSVLEALAEVFLIASSSKISQSSEDTGLESTRWLVSELDTVLQDGHWERWRGVGGQPQAVLWMHDSTISLLLDHLEFGHPRGEQVTILEADPVSSTRSFLNEALSDNVLALTKRDRLKFSVHSLVYSQSLQIGNRISAW